MLCALWCDRCLTFLLDFVAAFLNTFTTFDAQHRGRAEKVPIHSAVPSTYNKAPTTSSCPVPTKSPPAVQLLGSTHKSRCHNDNLHSAHLSTVQRVVLCGTCPGGFQGLPALRFRTQSCVAHAAHWRRSIVPLTESLRNCQTAGLSQALSQARRNAFARVSFAPTSTSTSSPLINISAQTPRPSPLSRETFAPTVATQLHAPIRPALRCHMRPRCCTALQSNDNTTTSKQQQRPTANNLQLPACGADYSLSVGLLMLLLAINLTSPHLAVPNKRTILGLLDQTRN